MTLTNELLVAYLKKQFDDTESIITYAKNNTLYYPVAYLLGINIEKQFDYKANTLRHAFYSDNIAEICDSFSANNVDAIFFKGLLLAEMLYDKPQKRHIGDIDVFVYKKDFPTALTLLIKLGYVFCNTNTFYNEHHIVFIRNNVKVELHKNIFNPQIGINEKYLLNNTVSYQVAGHAVPTFCITSSLLHLIYHLYMDTYFAYKEVYYAYADIINILKGKRSIKTGRFLYRAYEIALFTEKYNQKIHWDDIQEDLKCQNLCILFQKMIMDILEIFPNAFPESFLNTVSKLNYVVDNETDQLYKYTTPPEIMYSEMNPDELLCNYVNHNWVIHSEKNIHINVGDSFSIAKDFVDEKTQQELYCTISTEKMTEGLKLVFTVSDDDFYFSDINNYDTLTSDGVHLLLYGTEKYSYNSIFFFPKLIQGRMIVIPCDVRNNKAIALKDSMLKTDFSQTDSEYTITTIFSNTFIKENHLEHYLYMGLVISDCSSQTKRREKQLILAEDDTKWCNPAYFAKIDM